MGDKLDNAIRAIKSGDKQTGYRLLAELLRANPKGQEAELAWLWMGRAVEDPTKKRQCYERVLKLNKDNKNAQVELSLLLNTDVEASQMTPPDPKAQQTTTLSSPTATTPTNESKLGDRFSLAGWLCFIIGIGLMVLSIGTFFIFVPLFLAAFILSILSMSKGKVTSGLLLLLATLIIAPMCGLGMFAYNFSQVFNDFDLQNQEDLSHISFEDVRGYDSGQYMYLEGKVRNNGSASVDYVKVGVEWLDNNNRVLDSDWTYAVGSEGLRPGAAKSFEIISPLDSRMTQFKYFIMED